MKSLKNIVNFNIRRLMITVMIVILILAVFFQILAIQGQSRENANATFTQISQIISETKEELEILEKEYEETCLLNAEVISYTIQNHPEILGNVTEFRQLAYMMQVDEIHIFDDSGKIFTGTHPEYFNFTFDSGEQMNFFKPMLEDKSLRLCQDITPNTAEGKLVQYSAIWSADGKYIVQVGMYPDAVLEMTEKNELSYIFSLLRGNPGVSLYAIDPIAGTIIGSSSGTDNGKRITELGLSKSDTKNAENGIHLTVNGIHSYCFFKNIDGTDIGYVVANDHLYSSIPTYTLILAVCLIIIAAVLVIVVQRFTERYIIGSISATNEALRAVSDGDFDKRVSIESSLEFSELRDHINDMITSLLENTDKMSIVLNKVNMRVGAYELNLKTKAVRFTEQLPGIFGLSDNETAHLAYDYNMLNEYISRIRKQPIPELENTYRFVGKNESYIKLEEVVTENYVLGIAVDVTEEVISRKKAELERDIDPLTGIFNRRGMENRFDALFTKASEMGFGALIMIDSDDLKYINDTYGHSVGDLYLKRTAKLIQAFTKENSLVARIGGDEFVLLIYGYQNEDEVKNEINRLNGLSDSEFIVLDDGTKLPIHFSFGYTMTDGSEDYSSMLSAADIDMYKAKRIRKSSPLK